jgi:hypothetical protein
MAKWKAVVDKLEDELFSLKFVNGFGVAYKFDTKTCRFVNEIKLTVVVDTCFFSLKNSEKNKIKKTYGPARWPVQLIPMPNRTDQGRRGLSLKQVTTQPVDPLVGGVEIGNGRLCRGRSGVLGAIVFDRSNGHALGLSVHHAVDGDEEPCGMDYCLFCSQLTSKANRSSRRSWWDVRAIKDDPISQPNTGGDENRIGKLFKIHKGYDAAVFKLDSEGNRDVKPIVNGLSGEVGEPVEPVLGASCLFRSTRTQTQGCVTAVMRMKYPNEVNDSSKSVKKKQKSKSKPSIREEIWFQVDKGYSKTYAGDSGGLWVTEKGNHPIGLHTGEHWFRNNSGAQAFIPRATAMTQLVDKFHRFSFSPVSYNRLLKKLCPYFNAFVDAPESKGFFSFSLKTTGIETLQVQKYDDSGKKVGRRKTSKNGDVDAINGFSVACLGSHLFGFWRSMSTNQIKMARWNEDGERVSIFGQKVETFHSELTTQKPAVVTHKERMFMAFVDEKGKVGLRISDGVNWNFCWTESSRGSKSYCFGQRVISAPALASYKNKLMLAWVSEKGRGDTVTPQINMVELKPSLGVTGQAKYPTKIVHSQKLPGRMLPQGDIAIAVSQRFDEVFLAFTALGGSLEIYSLPISGDWSKKAWAKSHVIHHDCMTTNPPTLFSHDGNVICARETSKNHH